MTEERKTPYNSTYPKVAVQWLNQALCFYSSSVQVDSGAPKPARMASRFKLEYIYNLLYKSFK
jgi:hypothetical protein